MNNMKSKLLAPLLIALPTVCAMADYCTVNQEFGGTVGSGFDWDATWTAKYTCASWGNETATMMNGWNSWKDCSGAYTAIDIIDPISTTSMSRSKTWSNPFTQGYSTVGKVLVLEFAFAKVYYVAE